MLFDVLPDDRATSAERARYGAVIDPSDARVVNEETVERLPSGLSRFEAPARVRVSASRPARANEITLHFVNYNRKEPADKGSHGHGIKDERPIPAPASQADLALSSNRRARRLEFLTPEHHQPREITFEQVGARIRFRVPEFLVYGVVRIQLSQSD